MEEVVRVAFAAMSRRGGAPSDPFEEAVSLRSVGILPTFSIPR
jgi:hypothetical protein